MAMGIWIFVVAVVGVGFYFAAFTDAGEELAQSMSGLQAFLGSGAGGLVAGLLLSLPANGCAELQCKNILGWATISLDAALGVATVWGLFFGLVGLWLRAVATVRRLEREKQAQRRADDRPG